MTVLLLSGWIVENRRALIEFLAEPGAEVLPTTHRTALLFARLFAQLRRSGTPIPINDVWIAAAAVECHGHLLTFDRDFSRVEDLESTVFSW